MPRWWASNRGHEGTEAGIEATRAEASLPAAEPAAPDAEPEAPASGLFTRPWIPVPGMPKHTAAAMSANTTT